MFRQWVSRSSFVGAAQNTFLSKGWAKTEMLPVIDTKAAEREGLVPVRCRKCGTILAYQTADGNELHTSERATIHARTMLRCKCSFSTSWRPSRGPKTSIKSTISPNGLDRPR